MQSLLGTTGQYCPTKACPQQVQFNGTFCPGCGEEAAPTLLCAGVIDGQPCPGRHNPKLIQRLWADAQFASFCPDCGVKLDDAGLAACVTISVRQLIAELSARMTPA